MPQDPGFELTFPDQTEAEFVPLNPGGESGKDLQIIDMVTKGMPLEVFSAAMEDPTQRGRGVVFLAYIGLSIRAKYPQWTVERIVDFVENLEISNVGWLDGEQEANGTDPLAQEPKPGNDTSVSPSDESESSVIPVESSAPEPNLSTSEPSSETPA
jgi:hypothetical protein